MSKRLHFLRNLTFPIKLALSFGSVVTLNLVIFAMMISSLVHIRAVVTDTLSDANDAAVACSSAREQSITMGYYTLAFNASGDEKDAKAKLAADKDYNDQLDKTEKLSKHIGIPGVQDHIEKARALDEKCDVLENQALDLVRADKHEQARDLLVSKWTPLRSQIKKEFEGMDKAMDTYHERVEAESAAAVNKTIFRSIVSQIVVTLIVVVLSYRSATAITSMLRGMIGRIGDFIVKDVQQLSEGLTALADGDLTPHLNCLSQNIKTRTKDELGQLADMFNQMLTATSTAMSCFNTATGNLRDLVQQMRENAGHVGSASDHLSLSSDETSKAAEEVATGAEKLAFEMAQSLEHVKALNNSVQSVRSAVNTQQEATTLATTHVSKAVATIEAANHASQIMSVNVNEAGDAVGKTVESMSLIAEQATQSAAKVAELDEKGKQVGQIVTTITGIADQTNLLALNAAIEAARAGEHGRGFAIVAEEVRKLAEQTKEASVEIGGLIQEVRNNVGEVVTVIESTARIVEVGVKNTDITNDALNTIREQADSVGQSLQEVGRSSEQLLELLTAVGTASDASLVSTEEIASTAEIVAHSVAVGGEISESAAASAEELSAGTQEVNNSAESLKSMAEKMQSSVKSFILDSGDHSESLRKAA